MGSIDSPSLGVRASSASAIMAHLKHQGRFGGQASILHSFKEVMSSRGHRLPPNALFRNRNLVSCCTPPPHDLEQLDATCHSLIIQSCARMSIVGKIVGERVGERVGIDDGYFVGGVGTRVGAFVGVLVGAWVGFLLGVLLGLKVGN